MKVERKLVAPIVLAALVLLPLLAYVAGYFWLRAPNKMI
jgi:ABC-type transporter Mla maintaining outer membrane lipid asymmetry permease subunit MlaE